MYLTGIDIGSTTVKAVVLDEKNNILFKEYKRHFSNVRETAAEMFAQICELLNGQKTKVSITGSAGLGVSDATGISFVQEVYATRIAVETLVDGADAVVELGGEDAKILFITGGSEERMNGTCAGGTGAFIDQMASLLHVSVSELDELSLKSQKIYDIASRCGVFAKSDIQPLMNQGARKEDLAVSIYQAIVDQTISGLAQGRKITGKVVFLGGPLTFLKGLQNRFRETLKLGDNAVFPENGQYFTATGAALYSENTTECDPQDVLKRLKESCGVKGIVDCLPPLFASENEYSDFLDRHSHSAVKYSDPAEYTGKAYLGIDAGSTTTKLVLMAEDSSILYSYYRSNTGELIDSMLDELKKIYKLCADRINIVSSCVTGYGEGILKAAFHLDNGLVETMAHYRSASHFNPDVDFILDIGGQDIKCFRIKNNAIDSIMLNEACSSGCGSFIETFASAWGYSPKEFAELGIFAEHPVNLGSRCTVFMNSSVKQAQKDGATISDISAGLAISVIKNAIYKVIRANSVKELGENIVVQGGTFLNNAILRAFEKETGLEVTRPSIAGLMGAYGCALYAREHAKESSTMLSEDEINSFEYTSKPTLCHKCTNNCRITVSTFNGNDTYISGNRCDKPVRNKDVADLPNIYRYKLRRLAEYTPGENRRGRIGIPFGLNMYENLPFWHTLLTALGFEVHVSPRSTRATYTLGQHTIPSDTVCYPAKLMHGHIEQLLSMELDAIFYPCMTYNFDEGISDNHYNCPVVAYYPELLNANNESLRNTRFLMPYLSPITKRSFTKQICLFFSDEFNISAKETKAAVALAYAEYDKYRADIKAYANEAFKYAAENKMDVVVLCGRPYHVDPEINHGISNIITALGFAVISEDSLPYYPKEQHGVLNQWTYHARLYSAAKYVCEHDNIHLVQLVSFGCGLDAITTDEIRSTLEENGKLYTQIKIDEISNLGAAKIRLRSLKAAIDIKHGGDRNE